MYLRRNGPPSYSHRDPLDSISRTTCTISLSLFRNNSISTFVNIRGSGDVPSLRLSNAVEGVTDVVPLKCSKESCVSFFWFTEFLMSLAEYLAIANFWNEYGRDDSAFHLRDESVQTVRRAHWAKNAITATDNYCTI